MRGKVIVVQGGQYGSEGKGEIIGKISTSYGNVAACVRTGAINAGHTVHYRGQRFAMQQVPCGWVDPSMELLIGPGAYIHPPTLEREILDIRKRAGLDITKRLLIDRRAGIHTQHHQAMAEVVDRHTSIGATGKGCAEATIQKISRRGEEGWQGLFSNRAFGAPLCEVKIGDVPVVIDRHLSHGGDILVEGTQGTLLDLHHGAYPYTTSRMTTAAAWLAEAGIAATETVETVLVVRTYPIRVAGNSGPLPNEINWWHLWQIWRGHEGAPQVSEAAENLYRRNIDVRAEIMGYDPGCFSLNMTTEDQAWRYKWREPLSKAPSEALEAVGKQTLGLYSELASAIEMTTVTKKPRRIAALSIEDLRRTATIERPTYVVVTFMNYLFPEIWMADNKPLAAPEIWRRVDRYLYWLGSEIGAPVVGYSIGPGPAGLVRFGSHPIW